jgi:hypothetical protein
VSDRPTREPPAKFAKPAKTDQEGVEQGLTDEWSAGDAGVHAFQIDRVDPQTPEPAIWEGLWIRCGAMELAPESEPEDSLGMVRPAYKPTLQGAGAMTTDATGPVEVDVMILYTPEARELVGRSRVEETIGLSVACANEAFRRSDVAVTLRLVHQGETSGHRESGGLGDELAWLRHDATVKALRRGVFGGISRHLTIPIVPGHTHFASPCRPAMA